MREGGIYRSKQCKYTHCIYHVCGLYSTKPAPGHLGTFRTFLWKRGHVVLVWFSWVHQQTLSPSPLQALDQRVKEEQRMMDEKVVAEMDQKVLDQQNTLEKAGVPGFYITTNPQVSLALPHTQPRLLSFYQALFFHRRWWCRWICWSWSWSCSRRRQYLDLCPEDVKEPDTSRASRVQHEIIVDELLWLQQDAGPLKVLITVSFNWWWWAGNV